MCIRIHDISVLNNCRNLHSLDLGSCLELKDISVLGNLINLKELHMNYFIDDISIINEMKYLQALYISERNIKSLSILKNFPNLHTLSFIASNNIYDISYMKYCKKLHTIYLHNCYAIDDITVFDELINLRTVYLVRCPKIKNESIKKLNRQNIEIHRGY